MSWLGMLIAIVAIWLAIKVIGFVFKSALWIVAILALYWFAAPDLGWPALESLW